MISLINPLIVHLPLIKTCFEKECEQLREMSNFAERENAFHGETHFAGRERAPGWELGKRKKQGAGNWLLAPHYSIIAFSKGQGSGPVFLPRCGEKLAS